MERFTGNQRIESKEGQKQEAYFSVSNLVHRGQVKRADGQTESFDIAILGGITKEGKRRFQAIGGGAKLSDVAIKDLRAEYPSIRFREGEESDDARFYIPIPEIAHSNASTSEEQQMKAKENLFEFVHQVMDRFVDPTSPLFKDDVEREISEELLETKGGYDPVLTESDIQDIHISYAGSTSPIQWEEATSGRRASAAVYHRIFHLYDIIVPEQLFEKLKRSDRIRILSSEDIAAIRVATEVGNPAAELGDGSIVVENIFPDFHNKAPE